MSIEYCPLHMASRMQTALFERPMLQRDYFVSTAEKEQLTKLIFHCWYIASHSRGLLTSSFAESSTGSADCSLWQKNTDVISSWFHAGGWHRLQQKRKELTLYEFEEGYFENQWFEAGYYRKDRDGSFYRDEPSEHDEGYRFYV